jgi:hypothetical protein
MIIFKEGTALSFEGDAMSYVPCRQLQTAYPLHYHVVSVFYLSFMAMTAGVVYQFSLCFCSYKIIQKSASCSHLSNFCLVVYFMTFSQ